MQLKKAIVFSGITDKKKFIIDMMNLGFHYGGRIRGLLETPIMLLDKHGYVNDTSVDYVDFAYCEDCGCDYNLLLKKIEEFKIV